MSVYFGLLLLLLWFFNVCYVLNIHQLFESVFWFDFLNASVKSFSYSKKECFSHYYHKIVRVFFSNLFESFNIFFFFNFVFMLWVTSAQWKQPMWYLFFQFNTVLSKYQNTQRSFYSKIKFNNIKLNKENIHIKIIFVNWATINIKIWEQFWDSLTTNTFSYLFRFRSVLVMRCWSLCVYFYLQSFFCILKSLKSIFNQNYTKHKETWKIKMIKQIQFEPKTKKCLFVEFKICVNIRTKHKRVETKEFTRYLFKILGMGDKRELVCVCMYVYISDTFSMR